MAVSSEDFKLKVVIDTEGADLSGIQAVDKELVGMGQVAESAIDRVTAAVSSLNSKASATSVGDGFKNITADAAATESSLNSLGKELAQVHSQFANLHVGTEAFDALKAKSQDLQAQIHQLSGASEKMISPLATTNTRALNGAMIDLGRVIQDMPYGMQGIANNLQQLPGSMGRLREEADATGTSMSKLLLQGLMSPAGVGIAVSAITALWVAWDMYGAKVINVFGEGEKASEEFKNSIKGISDYKDFTLNVEIAGMSKLDQLQKKLEIIAVQMKMLNQEEAWNSREKAQPHGLAAFMHDATTVLSGNYNSSDFVGGALANDKTAAWKEYGRNLTQSMWAAESAKSTAHLIDYGPARNAEAWSAIGYDDKSIVLLQEHLDLLGKQYGNTAEKAKEFAKTTKGAGSPAGSPAESVAGWNSLVGALAAVDAANQKSSVSSITLEEAQSKLMEAQGKVTAAVKDGKAAQVAGAASDEQRALKATSIRDALTAQKAAEEAVTKVQHEWTQSQDKANNVMDASLKATGNLEGSTMSLAAAIDAENLAYVEVLRTQALGSGHAAEQKIAYDALAETTKTKLIPAQKAYKDETDRMVESVNLIGDAFQSMTGKSLKGISQLTAGIKSLRDTSNGGVNQTTGLSNGLTGGLQIVNGLGQTIGGNIGNTVSSVASSSLAGASLATSLAPWLGFGGPTGALIGGGIALLSSLFSGGGPSEADNQKNSAAVANSVKSLADSGNVTAQLLMKMSGYDTAALANLHGSSLGDTGLSKSLLSRTYKADDRLIAVDPAGKGAQLVTELDALGKIETSIKGFADPAIATIIDQINYKWQVVIATLGDSADLQKAKLDDQIQAITGITADSISTMLDGVITSTSTGEAGAAFAVKLEESISASVRAMAEVQFVQSAIMPVLQPVIGTLVAQLIADPSSQNVPALLANVNNTISTLTPTIKAFQEALSGVGVAGNGVVTATATTTTATSSLSTVSSAAASSVNDLASSVSTLSLSTVSSAAASSVNDLASSVTTLSAAAQNERNQLLQTLYQITGNTDASRALSLQSVDPANQALQQQIWTLQDAKAAQAVADQNLANANDALATAQQNLASAQDALSSSSSSATSSASSQSDATQALTDKYNAATAVINSTLTAVNSNITKMQSLSDALKSTLNGMSIDGVNSAAARAQAEFEIRTALMVAQTTGNLPLDGQLKDALSVVAKPSTDLYTNFTDYARDFYRTANDIKALSDLTDKGLTTEEKIQATLTRQLDQMKTSYDAQIASASGLQLTATTSAQSLAAINSGTQNVQAALAAVQAAVQSQTEAQIEAARAATQTKAAKDAADAAGGVTDPNSTETANQKAEADKRAAQQKSNIDSYVNSGDDIVTQMYRSFLNRIPSSAEQSYWARGLAGGESPASIASSFVNSSEFAQDIASSADPIEKLYQTILLRHSDESGYAFWLKAWNNGASPAAIATSMMRDSEYQTKIAAVRGFADGGLHPGGWRIVGEREPELEFTGPSRIVNRNQAKGLFDISSLIEEIKKLRQDNMLAQATLARFIKKQYKITDKWDSEGMPSVRS